MKQAFIAGAAYGLGRALAEALAAQGVALQLVDRRRNTLTALAEDLHRRYGILTQVHVVHQPNNSEQLNQLKQQLTAQGKPLDVEIHTGAFQLAL